MSFTPQRVRTRGTPVATSAGEERAPTAPPAASGQAGWWRAVAIAAIFVLSIVFAVWVRSATIWPEATGLNEAPYDDEGVYAAAAQLLRQGKQPYRDYVYAHPPLGPVLLSPAVDYHFTAWGSPTTFMILRYASLAYSALTVGLVFLIAWRIWGFFGGALSAALLAVDPLSVWAGRHVMLENPLFFLSALAVLAYVVAREEDKPPPALLLFAGFFAAAAGGVKLQGLIVLAAMIIDLLIRRRGVLLANLLLGALILWLPLWLYLAWLGAGDPLGQFIFMQLLRPGDGLVGLVERARALWSGDSDVAIQADTGWLLLVLGGLALALLPSLLLRPAVAARRRPRRATEAGGMDLPRLSLVDGTVTEVPSRRGVRSAMAAIGSTSRTEPEHPSRGWSLLLPWLILAIATIILNRSFYDHYGAHLSLPLAIAAGALPIIVTRGLATGWRGRASSLAAIVACCALLVWLVPATWREDMAHHEDRLYTIVGRYANDAVGPDAGVFALDAQFPFRAARRPAREYRDRFVVDSYGMLLYHGLDIEQMSLAERMRRVLAGSPGRDPYTIMWRPAAQAQLRASIERSDLVIIDKLSDGRLTDETRQWLAAKGTLAERQDRYVIYRIRR